MKKVRSEFLNVDLDVKSPVDATSLLRAFGKHVLAYEVEKTDQQHWIHMNLADQPRNPAEAISAYAALVGRLRGAARAVWNEATTELDIGVQAGMEPSSAEWVLEPAAVEAAAKTGAHLRFTVYSPQLVTDAEKSRPAKRSPSRGDRSRRPA